MLLEMMSQNNNIISTMCAGDLENIDGLKLCKTNNVIDLYLSLLSIFEIDNSINANKFHYELNERSVDNFIKKINYHIN